jgi:hypothetical protein
MKLIYEILSNHSSDYVINNKKLNITIDNFCTDGHHAYNKVYELYKDNIQKHIPYPKLKPV